MKEKFNYDILFIGGIYEEGKEKEYLDKSTNGIQNAVNTHQWNFIHGLDYNLKNPVQILSARYVDKYPCYKEFYVKKNKWSHIRGANDENIGFINIKILKNIVRNIKLSYKAKKWGRKISKEKKIVICYSSNISLMKAAISAKKKDRNIKLILIIPDIPVFMDLKNEKGFIRKCLEKYIVNISNKMIKQFDFYIVLTEYVHEILNIDKKKCMTIEGIVNKNDEVKSCINYKEEKKKRIVYSGSLHKKYGIDTYIEAIKKIKDKNVEFYIFGSGEMADNIKQLSEEDSRIVYMGYQNRETVLKYQREAFLLINPRPQEEYTKYSFPSKLIEYMVSGRPVLTTKLECIPKEYYPYLYFIEEFTSEGIKNAIEKMINENIIKLDQKAKEAKSFILKNKNSEVQTKKMLENISNIL